MSVTSETLPTVPTFETNPHGFIGTNGVDSEMLLRLERIADRWIEAIDGWSDWMRAAGRAETTIKKRRYHLARLMEQHLHTSPWKLTSDDLAGWLSRQHWAPETRRGYRASLRCFYIWGMRAKHIKASPAADLPTVRIPRSVPRPTPDNVFANALAGASDRIRLILMLGAYAGLRRSEIAALRWDDFTRGPDGMSVRIAGKGGHVRIVPLADNLAAELDAEHHRRLDGRTGTGWRYPGELETYVFPGRYGGGSTGDGIGRAARKALTGHWSAHTLRHRFATSLHENGVDLLAMQELLGHASPETTRRYTQIDPSQLRDAVNRL